MHRYLLFDSGKDYAVQFIEVCITLPDEVTNGMLGARDTVPELFNCFDHGVSLLDLAFAAHGQNIIADIFKIICHNLAQPIMLICAR